MSEESTTTIIQKHVLRGVWTITGILLGINSYLIKEKVGEMTADLKALATMTQSLQIDQAVVKRDVSTINERLNKQSSHMDRIDSDMSEIRSMMRRR